MVKHNTVTLPPIPKAEFPVMTLRTYTSIKTFQLLIYHIMNIHLQGVLVTHCTSVWHHAYRSYKQGNQQSIYI